MIFSADLKNLFIQKQSPFRLEFSLRVAGALKNDHAGALRYRAGNRPT